MFSALSLTVHIDLTSDTTQLRDSAPVWESGRRRGNEVKTRVHAGCLNLAFPLISHGVTYSQLKCKLPWLLSVLITVVWYVDYFINFLPHSVFKH